MESHFNSYFLFKKSLKFYKFPQTIFPCYSLRHLKWPFRMGWIVRPRSWILFLFSTALQSYLFKHQILWCAWYFRALSSGSSGDCPPWSWDHCLHLRCFIDKPCSLGRLRYHFILLQKPLGYLSCINFSLSTQNSKQSKTNQQKETTRIFFFELHQNSGYLQVCPENWHLYDINFLVMSMGCFLHFSCFNVFIALEFYTHESCMSLNRFISK